MYFLLMTKAAKVIELTPGIFKILGFYFTHQTQQQIVRIGKKWKEE